ncbi:unnamed protein product [Withania somnifera]
MSCNGCRVLRKGCSENCILRPCLQWIETPQAQGHATVFVAKFFGRAGLMSFISNVAENQRPALFQSLLYEAAGRTVNPVNGAVGLLWTGNWHVCQAAVDTVLRGGALRQIPDFLGASVEIDEVYECTGAFKLQNPSLNMQPKLQKLCRFPEETSILADLDLSLTPGFNHEVYNNNPLPENHRRPGSPSMNSEESGTTTCFESTGVIIGDPQRKEIKLLCLFN